ncbi:DUF4157 domain-containing protein [Nostoc sp. KVJ3]|uniref:DUF4157 domain-containing protein n=1 Tax=Nostoc sp. KVJ3 TaxID=457945 RepID=UPI0022377E80|nr:DUF4157 domain-containing protein [Nostoc sp. KVJ3]MCW5317874.1 DUF4157 domain-containing protein [Nostoc sp. KVJ3]
MSNCIGNAIAYNIRKPMEVAFGADFSRVKVHTDDQSTPFPNVYLMKIIDPKSAINHRTDYCKDGDLSRLLP